MEISRKGGGVILFCVSIWGGSFWANPCNAHVLLLVLFAGLLLGGVGQNLGDARNQIWVSCIQKSNLSAARSLQLLTFGTISPSHGILGQTLGYLVKEQLKSQLGFF